MDSRIPICKPWIGEKEKQYVQECIESSWISSKGRFISKFEQKVSDFIGAKYCSSTSNGTTALHLALLAIGIKKGDEVITTNFTYVASTNSILITGATPVFCEIRESDLNIDSSLIEKLVTKKTKAILVTNVYGYMVDLVKIKNICKKHNLYLIEDAAESFGASLGKDMSGSYSDISTFSFFGNKTITTGEGGMVICKQKKHFEKIKQLKNQGNSLSQTYFHDILGYNYRMTNIQAAIGCAQIDNIKEILERKSIVYHKYEKLLSNKVKFLNKLKGSTPSYWMVPVIFDKVEQKRETENILNKNNIETRPFFTPIDLLPFYENSKCVVAKSIYRKGLLLPSFPSLRESEIEKICSLIIGN